MLEHVFFNVAGEDPGYRPVVLVEQAGISPAAREALFAAAFNVLKAKWVTMVPAPPLSPFLSGDQYAVVVDIGMQL
jgi:actin-related protein